MKVSLIATIRNEAESIGCLLDSVLFQTRQPDEIVLVDGGSTDETVRIVESYRDKLPIRLITAPGANISQGRNLAIEAANGDIIASTDAGVVLHRRWLEELAAPFEDSAIDVVSGFFQSDPRTAFEVALGATTLPEVGEIDPAKFLPSSRSVAFRKPAWRSTGGYPEWLDYCEDLIFDIALKKKGLRFEFRPGAIAYFRPRRRLRDFYNQYYRYARGDGKAGLWFKRHVIRYAVYGGTVALVGHALYHKQRWLLILPAIGAAGYVQKPYRRLFRQWGRLDAYHKLEAAAMVPLIRLTGDVAKMIGYPVGLWWRLSLKQRRAAK